MNRQDRLLREHMHDPYKAERKLRWTLSGRIGRAKR